MRPTLYCMCGLQASGKSTYAYGLLQNENTVIVSSDAIRKEFPEATNDTIFKIVYSRINENLKKGYNVVLDATNTTIKARRQIFLNLKEPCYKECIIMNTPYNECRERLLKRNQNCDRIHNTETGENIPNPFYVPIEILEKYYKSFEIPFYEEGWDYIKINHLFDISDRVEYQSMINSKARGFNQHNKHHTQDLFEHMKNAQIRLLDLYPEIDDAIATAMGLHDVGKLFTQTFGEDGQGHYYNHANVGAYELLTHMSLNEMTDGMTTDKTLDMLFYVNYHMHLYNIKTEKAYNKWFNIFGQEKFENLKKVHEADLYNHADEGKE